jgi:hypothetical protein
MKCLQAFSLLSLAFIAPQLHAQPEQIDTPLHEGFYLSPMATFTKPDGNRGLDDGDGAAISLGYRHQWYAIELSGNYIKFKTDGGGDKPSLKGGSFGGLLYPFKAFDLYALGNVGYLEGEHIRSAATFEVGLGYMLNLGFGNYQFGLRADARQRINDNAGVDELGEGPQNHRDYVFNVGLVLPFRTARSASIVSAPAAADSPVAVVDVDYSYAPTDSAESSTDAEMTSDLEDAAQ